MCRRPMGLTNTQWFISSMVAWDKTFCDLRVNKIFLIIAASLTLKSLIMRPKTMGLAALMAVLLGSCAPPPKKVVHCWGKI